MNPRRSTISVTDFSAQIAHCNTVRAASGLPLLDQQQGVRDAVHRWNTLLAEARARLRERAGRDLANNSFTHLVICREVEPEFRAYLENLTRPEAGNQRG